MVNTHSSKTIAIVLAISVSFFSVGASQAGFSAADKAVDFVFDGIETVVSGIKDKILPQKDDVAATVLQELNQLIQESSEPTDTTVEESPADVVEESDTDVTEESAEIIEHSSDPVVSIQEPEDTVITSGNSGVVILRDYYCAPQEGACITIINREVTPWSTIIIQSKNFGTQRARIEIDNVYVIYGHLLIDIINRGHETLNGNIKLTFSILD